MKYDYFKAVKEDVIEWIKGEFTTEELKERLLDRDEFENDMNDYLWITDSVTGNASGSYTFCTWMAEENLCHNLDLLKEAIEEFGGNYGEALEKGAEYCDVTIRCYLLGQAIHQALDELESECEQ